MVRAFFSWGALNTVTALEIASMPVIAEPPLAKARRKMNSEAPSRSPPPACPVATWPWAAERKPGAGGPDAQPDDAGEDERAHGREEPVGRDGEDLARPPGCPAGCRR